MTRTLAEQLRDLDVRALGLYAAESGHAESCEPEHPESVDVGPD